jgi:predicted branched-subunit amino acid permease
MTDAGGASRGGVGEWAAPFREGLAAGFPIALGYLAVSFSLGIAAKMAGLSLGQGVLVSFLCNASAGEYAGFTLVAAHAGYLELAAMMLVANARYLLMGCVLSQRFSSDTPLWMRALIAFDNTDEIFAVNIAQRGDVRPARALGTMVLPLIGWAGGAALGMIVGSVLPSLVVQALSVSLFGMFLAVIIPPARENHVVAGVVAVSFAASLAASAAPLVSGLSEGVRTILLTVGIAAAAALFPVPDEEGETREDVPADSVDGRQPAFEPVALSSATTAVEA